MLALSGCASGTSPQAGGAQDDAGERAIAVDGPTYESVEQVLDKSDVYVRGVVGSVVAKELDGGGNRPETTSNSVEVSLVELAVTDSSDEAAARTGSTVAVLWEPATLQEGLLSELEPGTEVVLLAATKSSADAPGIDSVPTFLAPIGGTAGVLDVADGSVSPRDPDIIAFAATKVDGEVPPDSSRPVMSIEQFTIFADSVLSR